MTVERADARLLPIACTLGPSDGAERLAQWRALVARAGTGQQSDAGRVALRFVDLPEVGTELERLVAAERECCSFLDWDLVHDNGEWTVVIEGTDDELRSLTLTP